jgi:hypothetical protein
MILRGIRGELQLGSTKRDHPAPVEKIPAQPFLERAYVCYRS